MTQRTKRRSRTNKKKQMQGGSVDPINLALILAAGAGLVYLINKGAKQGRSDGEEILRHMEEKLDNAAVAGEKKLEDALALQTAVAIDQVLARFPKAGIDKLRIKLDELNKSPLLNDDERLDNRTIRLDCAGPNTLNAEECYRGYISGLLEIIESKKLEAGREKEDEFLSNTKVAYDISSEEAEKLLEKEKKKNPEEFGIHLNKKGRATLKVKRKASGVKSSAKTKASKVKSAAAQKVRNRFRRGAILSSVDDDELSSALSASSASSASYDSSSSIGRSKRKKRKYKKRKQRTRKK